MSKLPCSSPLYNEKCMHEMYATKFKQKVIIRRELIEYAGINQICTWILQQNWKS